MQSKLDKAKAITEVITQHAKATMLNASVLINASRKKPRIISNNKNFRSRLLRRRRIGLLTANLAISRMMASAQLGVIMATPISKFPNGGFVSSVDESDEIIIQADGKIKTPQSSLTNLPPNSKIYVATQKYNSDNQDGK